jgi:hypothetical protein
MLELLFAFLELILEIFFEAAIEFAADFLGALILRGIAEIFNTSEFKNPLVACIGYVFLGGLAGGLSLFFFPHPLVHPSKVPGLRVLSLRALECRRSALHCASGTRMPYK